MPQLLDFLRTTVQSVHGRFLQSQMSSVSSAQPSDSLQKGTEGEMEGQWFSTFGEAFELSMQQLAEENVTLLEGQYAAPGLLDDEYFFY
jgi:hypothetical protein